ncbi:flagellar motor protein MotB [Geminicoccus roseus]|uniref:flagellar motor protein MotB n=1 Tax=Geminicoccus roseus TaxID=404900 RepID=UPI0004225DDC|nr:flagellar motor protein MotB [Geminicoccus roseus]
MAPRKDGRIVVRKVVEAGHGGHHGGAWKVAYADFVTAMMAFFLLMWLLGTTSKAKLEGLAEYFTDPGSVSRLPPGGDAGILRGSMAMAPSFIQIPPASPFDLSPTPARGEQTDSELADRVVQAFGPVGDDPALDMPGDAEDARTFAQVEDRIREALAARDDLAPFRNQLQVTRTEAGLRIELLDRENLAMFPSGSDRLSPEALRLLEVVAAAVADQPNRLSIRGHTDSRPFASGAGSDNWRLSSDRANATRLAMTGMGLAAARIAEVVGKADTEPRLPERPEDPRNRRISILLMNHAAPAGEEMVDPAGP